MKLSVAAYVAFGPAIVSVSLQTPHPYSANSMEGKPDTDQDLPAEANVPYRAAPPCLAGGHRDRDSSVPVAENPYCDFPRFIKGL
ncbi:hypothetical protein E6C67_03500 (plasmid) [Azospirillum sp. TSA2s]|uniref:hypothetical protein n=1 Tax=Azospirillum sp. TSA2s TaxID=709810 RepID=UPI0010AA2BF0|nr:hypothetical protein [Azospirillum sp. TSA2s]QCG93024.1 hypothetical protein E6C67_03500 [Azospirillum sp. TSA2s]